MWLLRGLYFTCKSLQNSQANKDANNNDLSAAFSSGYEQSLKQFHNFMVKGIFAVRSASRSCIIITHWPVTRADGNESLPIQKCVLCQTGCRSGRWLFCPRRQAQRGARQMAGGAGYDCKEDGSILREGWIWENILVYTCYQAKLVSQL